MLIKVMSIYIRTEDILCVSEIESYNDDYDFSFSVTIATAGLEKKLEFRYNVNHVFAERHRMETFHPMSFGNHDSANPIQHDYLTTLPQMKEQAKRYIKNLHSELIEKWAG